jgi:hypothetical protein
MVAMTYDGGGPWPPGAQPPGYPPPGYPAYPAYPGYPAYPPPGYAAYPPPGYAGYPGYPPPGYQPYGPPPIPPALKPGVIPLRPLTLAEIFNGAIAYIRTNFATTLGLTTVVVVVAQALTVVLQAGPLLATGDANVLRGEDVSEAAILATSASGLAGTAATALSAILLSGMLTVVVGRAVFGSRITIGEAWQRVRGRLIALLVFTALEAIGSVVIIAVAALIIAGVLVAANSIAASIVGVPLVLGTIALLVYLSTMLSFAPPVIVLERLAIIPAIKRSFALVKSGFWRVLGIRLLAAIVAWVIAGAMTVPFSIGGQILLFAAESVTTALIALMLTAVGSAIGQIVTAPFNAGVVVLLYADHRMRSEAFDLVLLTGAAAPPGATPESTDHLWLTRQP